jgi:hypothetical protein
MLRNTSDLERSKPGENAMSRSALFAIGLSTAVGVVVGSTLAIAQFNPWNNNNVYMRSMTDNWSEPNPLGALATNEGIYVNVQDFKIAKGAAKSDPSAQLTKAGARQVTDGAIIFRSGNKLYIVDGRPPAK